MLINRCKIRYLNLDKALAFPRNQVICLNNWTTIKFNIFCWNFAHVFVLRISTKWCVRIFFILFRSWVIDKPGFCEWVETSYFFILTNNSSSKQNKKNSTDHFVDNGQSGTCAKFQQKLLKSVVVGACENFQFFR